MLKVLAPAASIVVLFTALSFALFLGLQVLPLYGNIGLTVSAVLAAAYVYLSFIESGARPR